MSIIAKITQQPNDRLTYDIDFGEWIPSGDVVTTAVVSVDPVGLTASYALQHPIVRLWLSDGTNGSTYKVTILASTAEGRQKEVEVQVKIREY